LLGAALGYPFGYGFGYPGWYGYGYGYPSFYGGYGGYSYYPYSYYPSYPYYDYSYSYSNTSPYYGYDYSPYYSGGYTTAYTPSVGVDVTSQATAAPALPSDLPTRAEQDFQRRDYRAAVSDLRLALAERPRDPLLTMMLAQAQFATGQYSEAARAIQQAMQDLAPEQWGVVPANYRELYTNIQDYTDQLRALEQASLSAPNNSDLRFLLGFHYYYLGYPREAAQQLQAAANLDPSNQMIQRMLRLVEARLGTVTPETVPPTPGP
jgi:hypothetical protein